MSTNTLTLANLVDENQIIELTRRDEFLKILNYSPPEQFIKDHPVAKRVKYLPIDKVEYLLTRIFQQWNVEILREGQLLNSVYVTIRLNYFDPVDKVWKHQDGTGAMPIQTASGKSPSDLSAILSDAIMKGLPAAESYAVKDAAEKIGKIFGRDLNRSDTIGFTGSYTSDDAKAALEKQKQKIREGLQNNADNQVITNG